jgi:hypothetical protein
LRYRGLADFELANGRVTARPAPGVDRDLLPIFLAGGVLSHIISGSGGLVLHASAVEIGGGAIGLIGSSGSGKSTIAALLCAAGAPLVTDDALAITQIEGAYACHRGTTLIRLRPQAAELADRLSDTAATMETADGRFGLHPLSTTHATLPLRALVAIHPDHDSREVRIEQLGGHEAAVALLANPRVTGWRDSERMQHHFRLATDLATAVPILRARVPWGPPFADDLPVVLRDALHSASG